MPIVRTDSKQTKTFSKRGCCKVLSIQNFPKILRLIIYFKNSITIYHLNNAAHIIHFMSRLRLVFFLKVFKGFVKLNSTLLEVFELNFVGFFDFFHLHHFLKTKFPKLWFLKCQRARKFPGGTRHNSRD